MPTAWWIATRLPTTWCSTPTTCRRLPRTRTINERAINSHAEELVAKFDVRTPSVQTLGSNLSGGNQQKMVVAREFSRPIQLLIAAQPTRGIDVGSIEFIHNQIVEKRDEDVAVLVVSSELDEIMALVRPHCGHVQGRDHRHRAAGGRNARGIGAIDGWRKGALIYTPEACTMRGYASN